jgi:tungstate transport system substrate-binding protein
MRTILSCLLISFVLLFCPSVSKSSAVIIRCASTTSTQNSGLFDYLLPFFEKKAGISVQVVAVGTGAALEIGKRGDADVVFVHSKDDEMRLVEEGYFVNRSDVMYNDFVIVGPPEDPAGIKDLVNAVDAFRKIAQYGAVFVSRGDTSGTHRKEMKIWKSLGDLPEAKEWYLEVGQGMAKTLRIAHEKGAYTLTDRGTFLSVKDRESLVQSVLLEGDRLLFNQYGVMAVNPRRHDFVKYRESMEFINWLISDEGQSLIASFRDAKGNQLFYPNARK